jgi:SAM-dependent methyltransferase
VLDYGCADLPYRRLFPNDIDYVGADLPGNPMASLTIAGDGTLPVDDATFDAVISTQVLEHSDDPSTYLTECHRVLRPGGRLLLSTHGVFVYHPDPVDYWRWTSAGLQRAVELAGFDVVRFEGVVGLSATGLQLIHDAIYYRAPRILRPFIALVLQSLMSVADRYDARGANGRVYDAMVFVLIGEKS